MNVRIYQITKNLGLNKKEVDDILTGSDKTSRANQSADIYKAGTKYGTVGSSDIYKAGTRYGTISPNDAYKAGTYYGSISIKDF